MLICPEKMMMIFSLIMSLADGIQIYFILGKMMHDIISVLSQYIRVWKDRSITQWLFFFRHKLERGTMSAFQREARNIIEQDLPHIAHRDNIIRVWKDRSRDVHQILAKATPFLLFRHMPSFQFKYYFQVNRYI